MSTVTAAEGGWRIHYRNRQSIVRKVREAALPQLQALRGFDTSPTAHRDEKIERVSSQNQSNRDRSMRLWPGYRISKALPILMHAIWSTETTVILGNRLPERMFIILPGRKIWFFCWLIKTLINLSHRILSFNFQASFCAYQRQKKSSVLCV